jgi:hypothetical protein
MATQLYVVSEDRIRLGTICPLRDDYPERYAGGLAASAEGGLTALRSFVSRWKYVAPDAFQVATRMSSRHLRFFLHELRRDRSGKPSGKPLHDDFLELRMPTTMMVVSVVALRHDIPWGTAIHEMVRRCALVERGGALWPAKGSLRLVLDVAHPLTSALVA